MQRELLPDALLALYCHHVEAVRAVGPAHVPASPGGRRDRRHDVRSDKETVSRRRHWTLEPVHQCINDRDDVNVHYIGEPNLYVNNINMMLQGRKETEVNVSLQLCSG